MKPTSFISEHSAEYVLVKDIVGILSEEFPVVIPVYFWLTREGASIAKRCMAGRNVHIVAIYARRPKIEKPNQDWILLKINRRLFEVAQTGNEFGCPVLAGVPLVTNLSRFSLDSSCSWFRIKDIDHPDYDFELPLDTTKQTGNDPFLIEGPLSRTAITKLVREEAKVMPWDYAIEAVRSIKRAGRFNNRFFFAAGYRPFFVILPDTIE